MARLRRKATLAAEILAAYVRARRLLRRRPLAEALDMLRAPDPTTAPGVDVREGRRLAHAVQRTLSPLPTDTRCLVQALVVTDLLERRGTPSSLVLGVKGPGDFGAHAWVELAGEPLQPTGGDAFTRLAEL